jgi:hypothetical protein
MSHDDDTCPHLVRANLLEAENARLKADAERYRLASIRVDVGELHAQFNRALLDETVAENARLKAEVERLQSIHSIDSIGIEQLKAEVERLTADLNKMTKTPDGVDYIEVDVSFWTKSGSRLPSSYSTFWSNDKGVQS